MPLLAGFATREVPVGVPVFVAGYGDGRPQAQRVHDPVHVRVLVVSDGRRQLAWAVCDCLGVAPETLARWRRIVSSHLGPQAVGLLSATHTHTAPTSYDFYNDFKRASGQKIEPHPINEAFIDSLLRGAEAAVAEAAANMAAVSIAFGQAAVEPSLIVNRRVLLEDGSVAYYPRDPANLRPNQPCDNTVSVIRFLRHDGSSIVDMIHLACHPLANGKADHVVSADFPGALCRMLQRRTAAPAVFVQGACGDQMPIRHNAGVGFIEEFAARLIPAVFSAASAAKPLSATGWAYAETVTHAAFRPEWRQALPHLPSRHPLRHGLLRISNVWFSLSPGEPLGIVGRLIAGAVGDHPALVVGYSLDHWGYLATRECFRQGGYEVSPVINPREPDAVQELIRDHARLSRQLH